MYKVIRSEPQVWTVGFYDQSGKWIPVSDHGAPDDAAYKANAMNNLALSEIESLRAELEQVKSYAYALNQRCIDDTAEIGELRNRIAELQAKQVPEGYALVPIEPTTEMLNAADIAWDLAVSDDDYPGDHAIWHAMVTHGPSSVEIAAMLKQEDNNNAASTEDSSG